MEKNKLTVTINGRMYTLISEETREYMQELSEYVNNSVTKVINNNPSLMGERPIVLAALNICDELFKAELGGKIMREKAQKNYEEIIAENKRLREVLNNSEYEIDIATLQSQLEEAKREIEMLKMQLEN
ncbi:MAG: cell division protein ZapA [Clostridia bacterium]|nr:cell division protein ZapA [Clostridia bacterium]